MGIHHIINERREQLILKLKRLVMLHKITEMFLDTIEKLISEKDSSNKEFVINSKKSFEHVSVAVNLMGENVENFLIHKLNFLPVELPMKLSSGAIEPGDNNNVLARKLLGLVVSDGFYQLRKLIVKINVEQKELKKGFINILDKFNEVLKKAKSKKQIISQINDRINNMLQELYPSGGAPLIDEREKFDSNKIAEIFQNLAIGLVQMLMQFKLFSDDVYKTLNKDLVSTEEPLFKVTKLLLEIDKNTAYFNNYATRAKETIEEYTQITPLQDADKLAHMLPELKKKINKQESEFEFVREILNKNSNEDLKLVFDEIVEVWAQKVEIDKKRRDKIEPSSKQLDTKVHQTREDVKSVERMDEVINKRVKELLEILEPHIDDIVKKLDSKSSFTSILTYYAETKRFVGQLNPKELTELYQAKYIERTAEFNRDLDQFCRQAKQLESVITSKNVTTLNRYSINPISVPAINIDVPRKGSTNTIQSPNSNSGPASPRSLPAEFISGSFSPRKEKSSDTGSPRSEVVSSSSGSKSPLAVLKRQASKVTTKFTNAVVNLAGHKKRSNSAIANTPTINLTVEKTEANNVNRFTALNISKTERFVHELQTKQKQQQTNANVEKKSNDVKQASNNNFSKNPRRVSRFVQGFVDADFTNLDSKSKRESKSITASLALDVATEAKPKTRFTGHVAQTHQFWSKKETEGTNTNARKRAASAPAKTQVISKQKPIENLSNTSVQPNKAKTSPKPLPKPPMRKIGSSVGHSSSPKTPPKISPKIINQLDIDSSNVPNISANRPK